MCSSIDFSNLTLLFFMIFYAFQILSWWDIFNHRWFCWVQETERIRALWLISTPLNFTQAKDFSLIHIRHWFCIQRILRAAKTQLLVLDKMGFSRCLMLGSTWFGYSPFMKPSKSGGYSGYSALITGIDFHSFSNYVYLVRYPPNNDCSS